MVTSYGRVLVKIYAFSSGLSIAPITKPNAIESPIGWMPRYEDLNWEGLDFPKERFIELMSVDRELWENEILSHEELFVKLYERLPKELIFVRQLLLSGLWRAPEHWKSDTIDSTIN